MILRYDKKFLKQVAKLPKRQQAKLAGQLSVLEKNPFDARLHTKPLRTPLEGLFSFRITRDYRVLFRFLDEETIFLTHVKHRKEIYR